MMRTHYKNGDDIRLQAGDCDGCNPSSIDGGLCHERNCPDAWRDAERECWNCGCTFHPAEQEQHFCDDSCLDQLLWFAAQLR